MFWRNALLAAICSSWFFLSETAYSNWPQFQYDVQHTGYNPYANVQPALELRFQKRLGDQQLKALAICDGLAMTMARVGPTLGYDTMYCYDAVSGEDLWIDSIGPRVDGTAQVVAEYGMWYVQVKRELDGWLEARDLRTGEVQWTSSHKMTLDQCLAPAVYDSLIFFESGTYGGCRVLNAFTGEEKWWQWWYDIAAWSPAIFRDSVYAYVRDRFIGSAIEGQTKVEIVSYALLDAPCPDKEGSPVDKNLLYDALTSVVFDTSRAIAFYCDRFGFWAFDMTTREYLWQKCDTFALWIHGDHLPQPAIKDSLVFMPTHGRLVVYDIMTGDEVWTFEDSGFFSYPPVLTNNYVFVASEEHTYMVDLNSHQKVWSFPAGGYLSVANNMLYIGGYLGTVYAFGPVPTDASDDPKEPLPSDYVLEQNYPNPFNPATTISFALPEQSQVRLSIYNVLGREVAVLVDGSLPAGSYSRVWDGTARSGDRVSSGLYFYRLTTDEVELSKKMLLLK
jgi:outer membrane protein assembly factor BamB